jgi:predicted AlkP superfamily phosphohydrolase/phosphomutase
MSKTARVIVIGLDGATLDLVVPWAKEGKLPVLSRLMDRGSYASLRSVLPVLSSAAWASFMTGANPGKHGVFDFVRRGPGRYSLRPVTRAHIAAPSLWRILSQQGRRVCVINVPMTYPPERVNGYLVSGLGTPDFKPFTYPLDLGPRLLKAGYRVNRSVYDHSPGHEEAYLQDSYEITARLTDAALSLLSQETWDFFMVMYRGTDEVAHAFWHHMDDSHPAHDAAGSAAHRHAILEYYQQVDQYTGALLEAVGPDATALIMSDHGAGPLYKDVYLNEWLRQEGYLAAAQPAVLGRSLLARWGITREGVSRLLRERGLGHLEQGIKDLLGERIEWLPRSRRGSLEDTVDWPRTRAYSFGYHGQVYINLQGREPLGIVPPAEKETLCAEIERALRAWSDPDDGEPVVSAIYRGEQVFHGPQLQYAPDLVVIMRNLAYITRAGHEFSTEPGLLLRPSAIHQTGSHRLDGLLIAAGPAIRPLANQQPGASILDLAPTILHILGCRVPEDVDGEILRSWLIESLAHKPSQPLDMTESGQDGAEEGLTAAEEEELVARLEQLGYLG